MVVVNGAKMKGVTIQLQHLETYAGITVVGKDASILTATKVHYHQQISVKHMVVEDFASILHAKMVH